MANNTYDAGSISVLEGLEAVRKRPGMYIGSVSTKGLNHLIYEIVDNSVDEHLAGFCSQIEVYLEKDGKYAPCQTTDVGFRWGCMPRECPQSAWSLRLCMPAANLIILSIRQVEDCMGLARRLSMHYQNI